MILHNSFLRGTVYDFSNYHAITKKKPKSGEFLGKWCK